MAKISFESFIRRELDDLLDNWNALQDSLSSSPGWKKLQDKEKMQAVLNSLSNIDKLLHNKNRGET